MNSKKISIYRYLPLFAIIFSMALSGCSLDGISDENVQNELTEADLEAASQILGESLSDENDGIMASLNDALTNVSDSGFEGFQIETNAPSTMEGEQDDDSNSGRGEERNFTYSYDPDTGTHTITFKRIVRDGEFFKSVTDTLKYIFTDINGTFIERPRVEEDRIETIDFKGFREGIIENPRKESFFVRRDTFFIDGVSDATPILSIPLGKHVGEGTMTTQNDNGNEVEKTYSLVVTFEDIQIDKAVVSTNGNLEEGVTGILSWEMVMTRSVNGSEQTKTVTGTIEMNGDGTALLRFERFAKLFLINLDDGNVRDHDDEFEGRVKNVNIEENTVTLANERVVQLTDDTVIDDSGDVFTLEEVARALEDGLKVWAEGEGSRRDEVFVASSIKFETSNPDERGFDGAVTDVNLNDRIIKVNNEFTVRFNDDSIISESGDLFTLEAVQEALEQGKKVFVRGIGINDQETDADLLALKVKFEADEADEEDFEGTVTDVSLDAQTFTIDEGLVLRIGEQSVISESGDFLSLEAVADALENGDKVIAFGEGKIDQETDADLVIIEVKFLLKD